MTISICTTGYYSKLLTTLLPDISGMGDPGVFSQIETDLENVRATWRWAVDQRAISNLQNLTFALDTFYQVRSLYLEASDVFEKILKAMGGLQTTTEVNSLLVEVLTAQGWILIRLGEIERAKAVLHRGCEKLRLVPPPVGHQEPISPLGMVYSVITKRRCVTRKKRWNST